MFSFEFEHLNIFSAIFPSFFNLQNIVTIYLQDLHKEHRLYEYNNTKDAMEKIPSHFYKDFRLQIAARPLGMEPRWRTVTKSALPRRSYWKIGDSEQSTRNKTTPIFSQDRLAGNKIFMWPKRELYLAGQGREFPGGKIGQEQYETTPILSSTQNYQYWIVHSFPQNHSA